MSMDTAEHRPSEAAGATLDTAQWKYELVPLLALPQVDFSISIRSRFVRNPAILRIMRRVGRSSIAFIGYLSYLGVGLAAFIVSAPTAQTLAVLATVAGLPAALLAIGDLRFDMVRVLLATYDIWYFCTISTVATVLLHLVFNDARNLLMSMAWLSFLTNVLIDARIAALRRLWLANVGSAVCYIALGILISAAMIDRARVFDVIHFNGRVLPAATLIRDCVTSIVVVVLRNVFRGYRHFRRSRSIEATALTSVVQCVSFRCRLRFQLVTAPSRRCSGQTPALVNPPLEVSSSHVDTFNIESKTQLRFAPAFSSIDARDTLLPMGFLWRIRSVKSNRTAWYRCIFRLLAVVGFVINNVALVSGVVSSKLAHDAAFAPFVLVGALCSIVFVLVCLAATQRRLLRAVITSFDFLFVAIQALVVHFVLLDLCRWQSVMAIVIAVELLWSTWFMCWDALLPPARQRLGLTTRLAAWIGTGLIAVMTACNLTLLLVLPPHAINDRVAWDTKVLGHSLQFRTFSWYISCSSTILVWSLRIIWRLWQAHDTELVVLDGPVVFDKARYQNLGPTAQNAVVPIEIE